MRDEPAIPNAANAIIPVEKLRRYLLDLDHPVGGSKARFLLARGFRKEEPDELGRALHDHLNRASDVERVESKHGTKYVVRGELSCPDGKIEGWLSAWIVEPRTAIPRFVTGYPDDGSHRGEAAAAEQRIGP